MPIEPTVLVIDGSDAPRAALTHRIRKMGYRAMRAKTPEEAFQIVEEHRHQVTAALIPPDLAVADLGGALESLAARAPQGRLSYVLTGACPSGDALAELRAAGLRLALWEPIDDARLRFQVNRALAGFGAQELSRAEMRAPLDIPAHVIQAGRRKPARVYTLSSGGVYLDTERPAMRNAAIQVELDLWPSPVCAAGVVVYTSVPGNLRKNNLPDGMGVRFDDVADCELGRIRRVVAEASLQLTL
jgi:CheY-like chemotaxis protein